MAKAPELTPAGFSDGTLDPDTLTPTEREVAMSLLRAWMIDIDNEHYQYNNGFLDEDFYHRDTVATIQTFAPLWRKFGIYESRPEFRAEIDRILVEAETN